MRVDDTLSKSFQALQDNAEQGITQLSHSFVEQQSKLQKGLQRVDEYYQQWLAEQNRKITERIDSQEKEFKSKVENLDIVVDEIKNMASVKEGINHLESLLKTQNECLSQLVLSANNKEVVQTLQDQQYQLEQILSNLIEEIHKGTSNKENESLFKQNQLILQKQNERIDKLCTAIENMPSGTSERIIPQKRNLLRVVAFWILGIMLFLASGSFVFILLYCFIDRLI